MKVAVDLCCGKGGGTQAFRGREDWHVVGVDNDKRFLKYWQGERISFVLADVCTVDWNSFMEDVGLPKVDFLWASPPCERFSIACPQWPKKGIKEALEAVGSCMEAVTVLQPKFWILENPKGRLRWFIGKPNQSIRYSDYDMFYKTEKLTDLWANLPLPMVKGERRVNVGHVESHWFAKYMPRSPKERSEVPAGVSEAVYSEVQRRLQP